MNIQGSDLVNSVPKELWMEVCKIVQEAANKTIPKKKKNRMAKQLSKEALQIAEERREAKSRGERDVEVGLSRSFSHCGRKPWVPSTCAGDLMVRMCRFLSGH